MQFHFRNIPPIRDAKLELGDFTIIAGKNNSGKTYLSYALYGFLKHCRTWAVERREDELSHPDWSVADAATDSLPPTWRRIAQALMETGRFAVRVSPAALIENRRDIARLLAEDFVREALPTVFQTGQQEFRKAGVQFTDDDEDFARECELRYAPNSRVVLQYDGITLEISARHDDGQTTPDHPWLGEAMLRAYTAFLLSTVPHPFVLTGERLGIALFYRELDFTRNQLVELLQEHQRRSGRDDPDVPFLIIDKAASRYALPIKDNIAYTRSLPDRNGTSSELAETRLVPELASLVDGQFAAADGELRYRSLDGDARSFDIPLHRASSSARALMDFDFFVRHDARSGQLLIVDEPESHLDVDNQVALARLLARVAAAGIRVLVTTHSDYFVKEINNLIMAARIGPENEVVRELDYPKQARLPASAVRAYMTDAGTLKPCPVDDYGIEIPVFEEAARRIDARSRRLAAELYEAGREEQD